MKKVKAFCSWSGGKESALACYKARQQLDIEIVSLVSILSEDGEYSRSHGLKSSLLKAQAETIGIQIAQGKATWNGYEQEFKKVVSELKKAGIEIGIFGDIDLQPHRDWVERVCAKMEIQPILPLWKEKRETLMQEFIQAGFKAIVVVTKIPPLGEEWLGREIDNDFVSELSLLGDVDLCGENGEYHTFVYDGPLFKKPIELVIEEKSLKDTRWFLNLRLKE